MRTKHVAKRLAKQLTAAGIPAADLQGNLSQNARERNLAAFSSGEIRVLVATDVAARGVHVDDIALVIHVDPPTEHKAYLHRSGRTARAGASGTVVTLVLPEQRRDVAQLLRAAGIAATPVQVTASSPTVLELVGEVAPKVTPSAEAVQQAQRARADRPAGGERRGGAQPARRTARGAESGERRRSVASWSASGRRSRPGRRAPSCAPPARVAAPAGGRRGGAPTGGAAGGARRGGAWAVAPAQRPCSSPPRADAGRLGLDARSATRQRPGRAPRQPSRGSRRRTPRRLPLTSVTTNGPPARAGGPFALLRTSNQ